MVSYYTFQDLIDVIDECLNPYCSGRWSRTPDDGDFKGDYVDVLILIVVEDGLVQIWRNWYTAAD